jgi:hypothetical protein
MLHPILMQVRAELIQEERLRRAAERRLVRSATGGSSRPPRSIVTFPAARWFGRPAGSAQPASAQSVSDRSAPGSAASGGTPTTCPC